MQQLTAYPTTCL